MYEIIGEIMSSKLSKIHESKIKTLGKQTNKQYILK